MDGKDSDSLKRSLGVNIQANMDKIFDAGEGMGKSGSFFFFSHDGEYLVKTLTIDDFSAF